MFKLYKLQGQITPEFLGLRMPNFQGIVFTLTETCRGGFQISISVSLVCSEHSKEAT